MNRYSTIPPFVPVLAGQIRAGQTLVMPGRYGLPDCLGIRDVSISNSGLVRVSLDNGRSLCLPATGPAYIIE